MFEDRHLAESLKEAYSRVNSATNANGPSPLTIDVKCYFYTNSYHNSKRTAHAMASRTCNSPFVNQHILSFMVPRGKILKKTSIDNARAVPR